MSEKKEEVSRNDEAKVTATESPDTSEDNPPPAVTVVQSEKRENGSLDGSEMAEEKEQHHPEDRATRTMMPGLPPIGLDQLTRILRDPNMPSHHIMNEVADKIIQQCKQNESDDSSISSTGGIVGMQGLLDTIFDVTIHRADSDNSDDDETFQRIPREIPCSLCDKIFGSTMKWKTHVLVVHQDPSVLNIRRLSTSEREKKERSKSSHRKHPRNPQKPDAGGTDSKTRHSSKPVSKQIAETIHKEENILENQRQSLTVRPLQATESVSPSDEQNIEVQIPQKRIEASCKTFSCETDHKDAQIDTIKVTDNINSTANEDSLQLQESTSKNIDLIKDKGINLPAEVHAEPQTFTLGPNINPSSQKTIEVEQEEQPRMSDKPVAVDITPGDDSVSGRKRKATSPIQETLSASSSSEAPSLHSKRSRKQTEEEPESGSTHKLE